ncbi:hypothetical protein PROP_01384 [Propionicimonas sp. T2.31MG-18]|uniref:hypothetical protein n=1 Tax=Propionicimonas sp. T2.31MG-18 TaxID=3157620 RepID=UPI0035F04262
MHLPAWLPRPGLRSRVAAGVVTLLALVPALLRLPKVSVVACFETGHPLYQWVPSSDFTGGAHCVSAPTTVVSWTLMVAATLVVQLLLLPVLLAVGALLVRGARAVAASAHRILAGALVQLVALLVPEQRPVPVRVRADYRGLDRSRANPRRGPPSRSC